MYRAFNENTAVLFIDLINDFHFDRGDKLIIHTENILPHIMQLKRFAKHHALPIIYINDHFGLWQAGPRQLMDYCRNDRSNEVIKTVQPDEKDYFLIKPHHSAFYQTPLKSLLQDLEITQLILAGVAGDICILFTAQDAYISGYTLHIPENCIASNEKRGNDYALYLMRSVMKAKTDPFPFPGMS
ncbi:MAG TPA: isochorismatase family cysteine hydrolase [Virgibacillus sp.]|nr:isochorismatase family cysteine hydrolase [Virgibacillus sp.]